MGCQDSNGPFDPPNDEFDSPADTIAITGTISTPAGGRVEGVTIQLWGVSDPGSAPTYHELSKATSDATGEFSVSHPSCTDHARYFLNLEMACIPIGLREVGCGIHHFDFVWTPPGT
jgi:hypothetical protein